MRKNEADPVVSKSLSYFSRNRTFEAILLQNQANMPQNHCYFANYVPLCVQSPRYFPDISLILEFSYDL